LLPAARRDPHDGSDKDGAALLFDNNCLDEGDCLSVPSNVRKEAESRAPFHEGSSIGGSITPIKWRSGFQKGAGAGKVMTIMTDTLQRQEKPLIQFQILSTLIFMGSNPA